MKLGLSINNKTNVTNALHGTTTVGIVCKEGVILSSDTRAIAGGYFIAHKHVKKILKIDDHLAMTIAGGVADAQNVVDILRYHANMYKLEHGVPIPLNAAARLTSNVFYSARLFPYYADVLVGGYDSKGPNVFHIDLFGSLSEAKYVSTGSGSPVAYGILENEYHEGMSIKEGIPIALRSIVAAIKRNAGTGDGYDAIVITKKGFKELSDKEKTEAVGNPLGRV